MIRNLWHRAIRKAKYASSSGEEGAFSIDSFFIDVGDYKPTSGIKKSPTAKLFFDHSGRVIHKWLQYFPVYDRYLAPYKNGNAAMLEIGVSEGGSLELWRKYLGAHARIFGIDINPECANRVTPPNEVRIGSQADPIFLKSVIKEMGPPDIILDDGSHIAQHQLASFNILWSELKDGGVYIIEDTHTAYVPGEFEGGYRRANTAIELGKDLVDDLHGWYHPFENNFVQADHLNAVHFYDSMIVIEKQHSQRPTHTKIG